MGRRISELDWAATPLGVIEEWSPSLRSAVQIMLDAAQMATLTIGPERIYLYNDRASPYFSNRVSEHLGRPMPEIFGDSYERIAGHYDRAFGGESLSFASELMAGPSDGSDDCIDAWLTPIREPNGEVIAVLTTGVLSRDLASAERALNAGRDRQAFLLALSDRMREEDDPASIIAVATRMLGEKLDASRIEFAEIDEERGLAHIRKGWSAQQPDTHPETLVLANFAGPLFDDLRRGKTIRFVDVKRASPEERPDLAALEAIGVQAGISVPLLLGGKFVVNLNVHQSTPRKWSEDEVALTEAVAERIWDAVERARAEEVHKRTEDRFRALAVAGADSIYRMSADWKSLRELESAEFLAPTQMPEISWQDRLLPPEERARVDAAIERAIATKSVLEIEHRIRRADGTIGWIVSRAAPILDAKGEILEWFGVGRDVTAGKLAEQALAESEERMRQFGEASQDVLWIRDAKTLRWTYLNPAFETVYGLDREEALSGADGIDWFDLIVSDDRETAKAQIERVRAGEHVTFDYRIARPSDGVIRWLRSTCFPITDASGKVKLIGGIGHDATDTMEVERRLKTLVEGMPQLVWRSAGAGQWTWASPQWKEYTGQTEGEYLGEGWLDAVHPEDRDAAREAWRQASAEAGMEVEYRIRERNTGRYSWFQTRATPVRDEDGSIIEWLGTSTDIDEMHRLQQLQKTLLAELQHRVRNILGMVRALVRGSTEGHDHVEDYVAHLVGRLDAMARTQVMLTRAANVGVDLESLVRDELQAHGPSNPSWSVSGPAISLSSKEAEALTLAIHELATNSVKYGVLSGEGKLKVSWKLIHKAGTDWLEFLWRETCQPAHPVEASSGFGTELIEQRVPYELHGEASLDITCDGARARIAFPLSDLDSILETWPQRRVAR
ncbi:MAG: PAS domain-containing protein [Erythrobacter sp.]|nr:PAS domain-containing protein [Erythrobacter sp.]